MIHGLSNAKSFNIFLRLTGVPPKRSEGRSISLDDKNKDNQSHQFGTSQSIVGPMYSVLRRIDSISAIIIKSDQCFPGGPQEPNLLRNPVKRSFECQGGSYP